MSEEKCFCHLNGYKVKDADARKMIAEHDQKILQNFGEIKTLENNVAMVRNDLTDLDDFTTDVEERVTALENGAGGSSAGGTQLYKHTIYIDTPQGFEVYLEIITANPNPYNLLTTAIDEGISIKYANGGGYTFISNTDGSYLDGQETIYFTYIGIAGSVEAFTYDSNHAPFIDTVTPL